MPHTRISAVAGIVVDLSWPFQTGSGGDEDYLDHTRRCSDFLENLARISLNCLTLNINASLVKSWIDGEAGPSGYRAVENLKSTLRFGLVELLGCAANHPILPLVHSFEMRRQIGMNSAIIQRLVHSDWSPFGFFPPELAFGHEMLPHLSNLGFGWCLCDDAAYATLHGHVPTDWIPRMGGLAILLRSRLWSEKLQGLTEKNARSLAKTLAVESRSWFAQQQTNSLNSCYMVMALPRKAVGGSLAPALKLFSESLGKDWSTEHVSQLVSRFPTTESPVPPSSWYTTSEEFWRGDFFSRWKSDQIHHQVLWRLAEVAWSNLERLREQLDQAMCSKTFEDHHSLQGLRSMIAVLGAGQPELQDQIEEELSDWLG